MAGGGRTPADARRFSQQASEYGARLLAASWPSRASLPSRPSSRRGAHSELYLRRAVDAHSYFWIPLPLTDTLQHQVGPDRLTASASTARGIAFRLPPISRYTRRNVSTVS